MFVVIENTPGYLPDDDEPAEFDTLAAARMYARQRVQDLREFHWDAGDRVRVRVSDDRRYWFVVCTTREHDLGRVVEIVEEPA